MESALYGARLMNVFERSGELVGMSAVSDLVNGWPGGIIQASRHSVFVSPVYLVNNLYSNRLGTERLSVKVDGPMFDSSREGRDVPFIDVVASRSADGKHIFIKAVNTDQKSSRSARVDVTGVAVASGAQMEIITSGSIRSSNSFSTPDMVSIRSSQIIAGNSFAIELSAHSVSVISLKVIK
jgi:alpha-L-arabinofuranosidase